MGTRNLTIVHVNNSYPVAQYCQWDGYPSGQGTTILNFLHQMDRSKFLQNVAVCTEITEAEHKARWVEAGVDPDDESNMVTLDVSKKHGQLYPENSRDTGAEVLQLIADEPRKLRTQIDFAADSLFCEWAYVIDFDTDMFEVYKGFNKTPVPEGARFAHLADSTEDEYQPVALVASWPLSELPTVEAFFETFKEEEAA